MGWARIGHPAMKLLAKFSRRRVLAILMCVSVVTSLFGARLAGKVRVLTQWAIAPFGDAGMYVTNTLRSSVGSPKLVTEEDVRRLEAENKVLTAYVAGLQAEVSDLKKLLPEMGKIFGQIPRSEFPYELIPARVVARDSMPYGTGGIVSFGSQKEANRGARVTTCRLLTGLPKALPENLSVLTQCALIGRLTETWAFGATLQLVTDRGFRVNARIHRIIKDRNNPRMIRIIEPGKARTEPLTEGRNGNNEPIPAVAEGDGEELTVRGVSENDNVLPGDVLVTREDEFLPERIVIGEVVHVTADAQNPGRVKLRIRPYADLENLRFVYIVIPLALGPSR